MEGMKEMITANVTAFVLAIVVMSVGVQGQVSVPCTTSMISSFSPCLNYITQGISNGSSPNTDCCNSLQQLTTASANCACLIVTGSIPFRIPINRTLALSLPRACNNSKVSVQCKASISPSPSPSPIGSFAPAPSPPISTPGDLRPPSPSPAESDTPGLGLTPESPPVNPTTPTAVPGIRPVLTPNSAAKLSHVPLLFILGLVSFNFY
ncbi:hypothetical protein Sjap_007991 [Stephania japonica]|uniref:Bifunctional inhibitor/plant lipid transfer protein/seed storage helical domain-containing protein n=1 Tax=Stephania japonica TaxID=461633 RepID=A0AAP0JNR9_9MAGN